MLTVALRHWAEYNQGLTKLTNEGRRKGVLIATGCGHFIQKDDPLFVAATLSRMTEALGW